MTLKDALEGDKAEADDPRDPCLLLFSNPFEGTSSSNAIDQEIELVPIVAHKQYVQATRQFIEQSSPSSKSSEVASPISLSEGVESKRLQLPKPINKSKQPKLPPIITSWEGVQPTINNPYEIADSMASRNQNQQQVNPGYSNRQTTRIPFSAIPTRVSSRNTNLASYDVGEGFDFDCAAYQDWSRPATGHGDTGEILSAAVYDPNEHSLSTAPIRDYSEAIGIPSPIYRDATNSDSTSQQHEHSMQNHNAGLEAMIRGGLYDPDTNADENGFYINISPLSEAGDDANFSSVNVLGTTVNPGRPEVESVYAQVFAANPFGIDLSSRENEDLSMRATLFPMSESPTEKSASRTADPQPNTPNSSASGSLSEAYSEDDEAIITETFHRALSSIAKDKSLPAGPPSGFASAKALSILGQSHLQNNSKNSMVASSTKKKPAPLVLGRTSKTIALQTQKASEHDHGQSQKQQLHAVLAALTRDQPESTKTASRNTIGRRSKVETLLGMSYVAPTSSLLVSYKGNDGVGPRTNSTLYNKLYSQVLKPTGSHYSESNFPALAAGNAGYSNGNLRIQTRIIEEPIKRSTLSPTNAMFKRTTGSEPPVSRDSSYKYSTDYGQAEVSHLKIVKKRAQGMRTPKSDGRSVTGDGVANPKSSFQSDGQVGTGQSIPLIPDKTEAYHAYKVLEKMTATQPTSNLVTHRLTFQDMAGLSNSLRNEVSKKYNGNSMEAAPALNQYAENQVTRTPSPIHRKPTPQELSNAITAARVNSGSQFSVAINPPIKFQPVGTQRLPSFSESTQTTFLGDHGSLYKRPKSPVKKMFSNTVEMIGRMMPAGSHMGYGQASNGVVVNEAANLKISIHAADQNRLFGDLEYIIQDTANRFLLFQHACGNLTSQSVEKQARAWYLKNRPKVAQFLYPIAVQRDLVEQNLNKISLHGPFAGNSTAIQAVMHTWKFVAKELSIRTFCLPDTDLQHFLRESSRLLDFLGVAAGHMLHFQAWHNLVTKTIREKYPIPYSLDHPSFDGI